MEAEAEVECEGKAGAVAGCDMENWVGKSISGDMPNRAELLEREGIIVEMEGSIERGMVLKEG